MGSNSFPVVAYGLIIGMSFLINLFCIWNISRSVRNYHNVNFTCSYVPDFMPALREAYSMADWDNFYSLLLVVFAFLIFCFIVISCFSSGARKVLYNYVSTYSFVRILLFLTYSISWLRHRKALAVILGCNVHFKCPSAPEWALQNSVLVSTRCWLTFVDSLVLFLSHCFLSSLKYIPYPRPDDWTTMPFPPTDDDEVHYEEPLPTYEEVMAKDMELPTYEEAFAMAATRHLEVFNENNTPPTYFRRTDSSEEDTVSHNSQFFTASEDSIPI